MSSFSNDDGSFLLKEDLLNLIAKEKESYSNYIQLCRKYKTEPGIIAKALSEQKIDILTKILQKKTELL